MRFVLVLGTPPPDRPEMHLLLRSAGFAVRWVDEASQAIAEMEEHFSPLLVDLRSTQAVAAAGEVRRQWPGAVVIGVADPDRPAASERAVHSGITSILAAPLTVDRAAATLVAQVQEPVRGNGRGEDELPGVVACSPAMRDAVAAASGAGASDAGGVLISGEPGSGRRFLARIIHSVYSPPGGNLVEVDCADFAAPDDLEMALFGTVDERSGNGAASGFKSGGVVARSFGLPAQQAGARNGFTPAVTKGNATESITGTSLLYKAFGGSLLLMNPADMPSRVQGRLVRFLRDGEATVIGAGKIEGTIRPIACVDPGFEMAIEEGRVRPDLLKRLAPCRIEVPPIRDRREDIPALVELFLNGLTSLFRLQRKAITHPAITLLASLPFRGNARELRTLLRTLVEGTPGSTIRLEDVLANLRLDVSGASRPRYEGTLRDARAAFEMQYIREVVERHKGRISEAARVLGIQRTNLYRKMRALGVVRRPGDGGMR